MSAPGHDLPMASIGCALTTSGLAEQLDRYRQLGACVERITRRGLGLMVWFGSGVDVGLLDETIEIERGCCAFFTLGYDASERCLSIIIDGPDRLEALDALESALTGSAPDPMPGWSR